MHTLYTVYVRCGCVLFVFAPRTQSVYDVKAAVKEAIQLQKTFPQVVAGFDLVMRLLHPGKI